MDQIADILLKLRIAELEAHVALREIERAGLTRQIDDPGCDPDERDRAILRRERVIIEWGEFMTELHDLRDQRDIERAPIRRAMQN